MIVWGILSVLAVALSASGFWSGRAWGLRRLDAEVAGAYDKGWTDRDGAGDDPWNRDPAPIRSDDPPDPDEWDEEALAELRDPAPEPDTATLLTARQVDRIRADSDHAAWRRCLERDRAEWMADLWLDVSDMRDQVLAEPMPWEREAAA